MSAPGVRPLQGDGPGLSMALWDASQLAAMLRGKHHSWQAVLAAQCSMRTTHLCTTRLR